MHSYHFWSWENLFLVGLCFVWVPFVVIDRLLERSGFSMLAILVSILSAFLFCLTNSYSVALIVGEESAMLDRLWALSELIPRFSVFASLAAAVLVVLYVQAVKKDNIESKFMLSCMMVFFMGQLLAIGHFDRPYKSNYLYEFDLTNEGVMQLSTKNNSRPLTNLGHYGKGCHSVSIVVFGNEGVAICYDQEARSVAIKKTDLYSRSIEGIDIVGISSGYRFNVYLKNEEDLSISLTDLVKIILPEALSITKPDHNIGYVDRSWTPLRVTKKIVNTLIYYMDSL